MKFTFSIAAFIFIFLCFSAEYVHGQVNDKIRKASEENKVNKNKTNSGSGPSNTPQSSTTDNVESAIDCGSCCLSFADIIFSSRRQRTLQSGYVSDGASDTLQIEAKDSTAKTFQSLENRNKPISKNTRVVYSSYFESMLGYHFINASEQVIKIDVFSTRTFAPGIHWTTIVDERPRGTDLLSVGDFLPLRINIRSNDLASKVFLGAGISYEFFSGDFFPLFNIGFRSPLSKRLSIRGDFYYSFNSSVDIVTQTNLSHKREFELGVYYKVRKSLKGPIYLGLVGNSTNFYSSIGINKIGISIWWAPSRSRSVTF